MLKLSLYKVFNSAPSNPTSSPGLFPGDEVASTPLPSSLALLQCIGSQKAREDSRARAKSGVQNQISVLSRFARRRQTTDVVQY